MGFQLWELVSHHKLLLFIPPLALWSHTCIPICTVSHPISLVLDRFSRCLLSRIHGPIRRNTLFACAAFHIHGAICTLLDNYSNRRQRWVLGGSFLYISWKCSSDMGNRLGWVSSTLKDIHAN
jgi:hypothetical protein